MTTYADDIRRIAKQDIKKNGIGLASGRGKIYGSSKAILLEAEQKTQPVLLPPLTFEALTYDNTKDVIITDDSGTAQTFKTVATAKIIDANGYEYAIDTVTFTAP